MQDDRANLPNLSAMLRSLGERDPAIREAIERLRPARELPIVAVQVVVRTLYETRTLAFDTRPTPSVHGIPPVDDPKPWEVELTHPPNAKAGSRVIHPYGIEYRRTCMFCSGQGDAACSTCRGLGTVQQGSRSTRCYACGGAGRVVCKSCEHSGQVLARPSAVSILDEVEERRTAVAESGSLPDDVFLMLQDPTIGATPIHSAESPRLAASDVETALAILSAAGVADVAPVKDAIEKLAANPDIGQARIQTQALELARVPAFTFELDGRPVFIAGSPVRVYPEGAIATSSALLRWLVVGGSVVAVGLAVWLMLH